MSERKVNLEEILEKHSGLQFGKMYFSRGVINGITNSMKEACRQTLELAAENAEMKCSNYKGEWNVKEKSVDDYTDIIIDKQSILNTINQVE